MVILTRNQVICTNCTARKRIDNVTIKWLAKHFTITNTRSRRIVNELAFRAGLARGKRLKTK